MGAVDRPALVVPNHHQEVAVSECGCQMEARNAQERKTLMIVLGINAFMFIFELVLGLVAESSEKPCE